MYRNLNNSNLALIALLSFASFCILVGCGASPSSTISTGSLASSSISTGARITSSTTLATSTPILSTSPATPSASCGSCGDVNMDGRVDILDALIVAQLAARTITPTTACQQTNADVDGNGDINILDALRIANPAHHASFRCQQAVTVGGGGGVVPVPVGSTAPDPNQACQDLWLDPNAPFVSGSIRDNTMQIFDSSGTLLTTLNVDYVRYIRSFFTLSTGVSGMLILIRNWTGGITSWTSGKTVFQNVPHIPFETPRGNNAFYAATPDMDLKSGNAPTMTDWSIVCGYPELVIGGLSWVNSRGKQIKGYFLRLW